MLFVRRPSDDVLDRLLDQARDAEPTYAEVGTTLGDDLPTSYRHDLDEASIGTGQEAFGLAVAALRRWQAQIGAGIDVIPRGATVAEGETVLLLIRAAGLWTVAPCRVAYTVAEPELFRFAYATLPGHPEQGEASFAVSRTAEDDVLLRLASFSRPVDPLARLAKPLTRRIQRRVTLRYVDALREAVTL
jgi:uncharacterized protein (UPF0548 family)